MRGCAADFFDYGHPIFFQLSQLCRAPVEQPGPASYVLKPNFFLPTSSSAIAPTRRLKVFSAALVPDLRSTQSSDSRKGCNGTFFVAALM